MSNSVSAYKEPAFPDSISVRLPPYAVGETRLASEKVVVATIQYTYIKFKY